MTSGRIRLFALRIPAGGPNFVKKPYFFDVFFIENEYFSAILYYFLTKCGGFLVNTAQLKTALQIPLKTAHFTAKYAYFRLLSFFLACGRIRIAAGKEKPFPNTALETNSVMEVAISIVSDMSVLSVL